MRRRSVPSAASKFSDTRSGIDVVLLTQALRGVPEHSSVVVARPLTILIQGGQPRPPLNHAYRLETGVRVGEGAARRTTVVRLAGEPSRRRRARTGHSWRRTWVRALCRTREAAAARAGGTVALRRTALDAALCLTPLIGPAAGGGARGLAAGRSGRALLAPWGIPAHAFDELPVVG